MSPRARLRRRILPAAVLGLAIAVGAGLAACDRTARSPEDAAAEQAWNALVAEPTSPRFRAFRDANLAAARAHGEMHDRWGVLYQVRAFEAQADEAVRTRGAAGGEATRLAFEVTDAVDDLERKDLVSAYEEVLPGAAARLRAAREKAASAIAR